MKIYALVFSMALLSTSAHAKKITRNFTVKKGTYAIISAPNLVITSAAFKLGCRVDTIRRFLGFPKTDYIEMSNYTEASIVARNEGYTDESGELGREVHITTIKFDSDIVLPIKYNPKRKEMFSCYGYWEIEATNTTTGDQLVQSSERSSTFQNWINPQDDDLSPRFQKDSSRRMFYHNRHTKQLVMDFASDASLDDRMM